MSPAEENDKVSLRQFLVALIDERWEGHEKVHQMLQDALMVSVKDMNRRLAEMNQFREQISSERSLFISKAEYESRHRELMTTIEANGKRITSLEMARSNWEGRIWMLGGVGTAVVVGINVLFRWWPK